MGVKKHDPFASGDLDFSNSFDFDDVTPDDDFFGDDVFAQEMDKKDLPKLTLEGLEKEYEEIIERDADNANQAAIDARIRYQMVDEDRMQTGFFFTVVFQNAKQRQEFCQKSNGLIKENDIYLDGMDLADRLGIELETPYVTDGKLRKAWRRILGLAMKPGRKNETW